MDDYKITDQNDFDFPRRLKGRGWPPRLYYRGLIECKERCVAIVGARAASPEGMKATERLAAELARAEVSVISGGALGIDTAAHRGGLLGRGHTLAVLACGIDQYYPQRNHALFEAMLSSQGAILTPFEVGYAPKRWHFVRRNQLIATMADVVVVVEAGLASGSLHTARFAIKAKIPVAAYSGSPGCEALLSHGAALVSDAGDVLDLFEGKKRNRLLSLPEPGTIEARVVGALRHEPVGLDALCSKTGISAREMTRVLLRLELSSLVLALPGLRYQVSPLLSKH